jgi:hypothetical protein
MTTRARTSQLAKALVALLLLAALLQPTAARADQQTGRIYVSNPTKQALTLACRYYLDGDGNRQEVRGVWSIKPGVRGDLKDQGVELRASRFELTLVTEEGKTDWHLKNFDSDGDLTLIVTDELLRQHRARLAPPRAVAARGAAPRGPSEQDKKNAVGKIIAAAVLHAIAGNEPENLLEAILVEAARRARDELIEGALKDVFKDRPLREIQAARRVICLSLDGKLTTAHLNEARAKEALLARLKEYDPDIGAGVQIADFIYAVSQARRR